MPAFPVLASPAYRPEVREFRRRSVRDDAAWCHPAPGVERPDVLTREPPAYRLGAPLILILGLLAATVALVRAHDGVVGLLVSTAVLLGVFAVVRRIARSRRLDAPGGYWERMLRTQKFIDASGLAYEQSADPRRYAGITFADDAPSDFVTVVRDFARTLTAGNLVFVRSRPIDAFSTTSARGILMLNAPAVTIPELIFAAAGSGISLRASGLEPRQLEGDFTSHYTLWHPPGYGRDALHVVQPDVMADLIDNGEGLSLEILDGLVIIMWPRALRWWNPDDAAQVWRVAAGVREALERIPRSWREERPAGHPERAAVRDIRRRAGLPTDGGSPTFRD